MRYFIFLVLAVVLFNGCTAKEFCDGVSSGVDDVTRVIRGNNN